MKLRHLLGGGGQLVVDVLAVGLGVVGLAEADQELAVLLAEFRDRVGGLGGAGDRERGAGQQRGAGESDLGMVSSCWLFCRLSAKAPRGGGRGTAAPPPAR